MNLVLIVTTIGFLVLKVNGETLSQTIHCQKAADCPKHNECKEGVCKEIFWCKNDSMCEPGECCMLGGVSTVPYCGNIPRENELCWINGGGFGACPCETGLACKPYYAGLDFGTCEKETE